MATRVLGLTVMTEAQQNKWITHNTALHELDGFVGGVKSRSHGGPPSSPAPSEGDAYIVDVATGAWSGATVNDLAVYYLDSAGTAAWLFTSPAEGPQIYCADEDTYISYGGSPLSWQTVASVATFTDIADASPSEYTLVYGDMNQVLRFENTVAMTVFVPDSTSVEFPIGTVITIRRAGAGALTISTTSPGATFNGSVTLAAQHDQVTLMQVDTDIWDAS